MDVVAAGLPRFDSRDLIHIFFRGGGMKKFMTNDRRDINNQLVNTDDTVSLSRKSRAIARRRLRVPGRQTGWSRCNILFGETAAIILSDAKATRFVMSRGGTENYPR